MPPNAVRTIRDLIFWQYAKLIAESSGVGKKRFGFVMDRYKKLSNGEINWSTSIREYIKEREMLGVCVYCGNNEELTLDHILPRCRGGPNIPDNAVWVCRHCNCSKGDKRLYEWFGANNRDKIPRIAEGKYLKLLYKLHENQGTLDKRVSEEFCEGCDLGSKCETPNKLSVYCLEGQFLKHR